ncbi:hypothetical protein TWF102_000068 [Orbilia oligospora]|uniref:Uncharacterized protein n=1 Tax=Orbilia oligospora TaxID=2813651 RepID=A0A7C8JNK7_ORBOL|nr:hypothetical protein TWF102_000068 [Orbilia oligospora]
MPRCHKLTYIDSRRIILRMLNNAFEQKDMLPALNDPLITSEEKKLVEKWDKEIVRLYADVSFLRRSKKSEDVILWKDDKSSWLEDSADKPKFYIQQSQVQQAKFQSNNNTQPIQSLCSTAPVIDALVIDVLPQLLVCEIRVLLPEKVHRLRNSMSRREIELAAGPFGNGLEDL